MALSVAQQQIQEDNKRYHELEEEKAQIELAYQELSNWKAIYEEGHDLTVGRSVR